MLIVVDLFLRSINSNCFEGVFSGIARVPCALGQEIFLRLPSTKLTEFELKTYVQKCGRSKGRTFAVVTRFY